MKLWRVRNQIEFDSFLWLENNQKPGLVALQLLARMDDGNVVPLDYRASARFRSGPSYAPEIVLDASDISKACLQFPAYTVDGTSITCEEALELLKQQPPPDPTQMARVEELLQQIRERIYEVVDTIANI
jgi:hypothetical protein